MKQICKIYLATILAVVLQPTSSCAAEGGRSTKDSTETDMKTASFLENYSPLDISKHYVDQGLNTPTQCQICDISCTSEELGRTYEYHSKDSDFVYEDKGFHRDHIFCVRQTE